MIQAHAPDWQADGRAGRPAGRTGQALLLGVLAAALTWSACTASPRPILASDGPTDAGRRVELALPLADDSVRFAVIGDSGTGGSRQYELAALMTELHAEFPFSFVLMLGDNLYGGEDPDDYVEKFERPYAPLLEAGVKFYASLGNHDEPTQRYYELFNMGGERYYSFTADAGSVRFFALESEYMTPGQLEWLDEQLERAREDWKIAFFHHPLYSSGRRHGSDEELREALEPIFLEHGVDVVFSGHDHFYERVQPQSGILYFISGAAGRLRRGNINRASPLMAVGFDQDLHFMLVEIAGDTLHFDVVSRAGRKVDCGSFRDDDSIGTARVIPCPAPTAPAEPSP